MGGTRVLTVCYSGYCAGCDSSVAPGAHAWWDPDANVVWCERCRPNLAVVATVSSAGRAHATRDDADTPMRPAQAEFDHRQRRREEQSTRPENRTGGAVFTAVTGEPPTIKSLPKGAAWQGRAALQLERTVGDGAVFLHDRAVPGSSATIDLLAVASTGVWIIDIQRWSGKVEQREAGGWPASDTRLYVDGQDHSDLVLSLGDQKRAVDRALAGRDVPIARALCVAGAEWDWFEKPFLFRGTWITWQRSLAGLLRAPGRLDPNAMRRIAVTLAEGLPAR